MRAVTLNITNPLTTIMCSLQKDILPVVSDHSSHFLLYLLPLAGKVTRIAETVKGRGDTGSRHSIVLIIILKGNKLREILLFLYPSKVYFPP